MPTTPYKAPAIPRIPHACGCLTKDWFLGRNTAAAVENRRHIAETPCPRCQHPRPAAADEPESAWEMLGYTRARGA